MDRIRQKIHLVLRGPLGVYTYASIPMLFGSPRENTTANYAGKMVPDHDSAFALHRS